VDCCSVIVGALDSVVPMERLGSNRCIRADLVGLGRVLSSIVLSLYE